MISAGQIISGCWIGFLLYWYIHWQRVKPVAERQKRGIELFYQIPFGAGCYLLFAHRRLPAPLQHRLLPDSALLAWFGAALCVLGLLGAIWARKTLAGNWSSDVTLKEEHKLIEQGPYRWVRHPIYTSLLLMALGTALAIGSGGAFLACLLIFISFWIKLKQEENLLLRHFQEEYPAYRKRVKALIPFLF